MTDPLEDAPRPEDRPFGPPGQPRPAETPAAAAAAWPAPRPVRTKPSLSGRIFRAWLAATLLAVLGCAVFMAIGFALADTSSLHIHIGPDAHDGILVEGLNDGARSALAVGALLLGLVVLLLLPLILLLAVAAVAVALVVGLVAPLLGLAIALVVVSSPLWLVAGFFWLLGRRRAVSQGPRSATISA